jgi:hypothetical protein
MTVSGKGVGVVRRVKGRKTDRAREEGPSRMDWPRFAKVHHAGNQTSGKTKHTANTKDESVFSENEGKGPRIQD